jgi:murein L,D-transpeptidase YafK
MRARCIGRWLVIPCVGAAALGGLGALAAVTDPGSSKGGPGSGAPVPPAQADQTTPPPAPYSLADRERRLAEKGMTAGNPIMIRIFKRESELELWMQREGRYDHFATYPICTWSGRLGPKLREGDRQAPEGLYSVGLDQLVETGRRPRSFDIGFPNAFDRAFARTGSYIFVHGGCTSVGCFAMTNPIMEEIYTLGERAIRGGQEQFEVHAFPFRMTEANMAAHASSPWHPFWVNLKEAYDAFERTHVPPRVSVCAKRYLIRDGSQPELPEGPPDNGAPTAFGICEDAIAGIVPIAGPEAESTARGPVRIHRVVYKARNRRVAGRIVKRNVRANYAAARRARMAAHARRMAHQ